MMDLHVYLHIVEQAPPAWAKKIDDRLASMEAGMSTIIGKETVMSKELDDLTAEVERSTSVQTSVQTLVQGLADQIVALKDEPAKLQALADKLRGSDDATAAAVTANTPADTGGGTTSGTGDGGVGGLPTA